MERVLSAWNLATHLHHDVVDLGSEAGNRLIAALPLDHRLPITIGTDSVWLRRSVLNLSCIGCDPIGVGKVVYLDRASGIADSDEDPGVGCFSLNLL